MAHVANLQWLDLGECELTDVTYLPELTYYPKLEKIIFPKNLESTSDLGIFETAVMLRKVVAPESLE